MDHWSKKPWDNSIEFSLTSFTAQGIRMDLTKKSKSKQKTITASKGVLKSSTLGHNNKIFQSSFGLVMQPIFPAIKKGCSVN